MTGEGKRGKKLWKRENSNLLIPGILIKNHGNLMKRERKNK